MNIVRYILQMLYYSLVIFLSASALIGIIYHFEHKNQAYALPPRPSFTISRPIKVPIKLTVYSPTAAQCGNNKGITASGLKVDKKNPQRWVAVGIKWFKKYKLQNITIICPAAPFLNGIYKVVDTSGADTRIVEILNVNPELVDLRLCVNAFIIF